MTNSREKGKRLERELALRLRESGFRSARRGQQYRGGEDSQDVQCEELPRIHIECKGGKQLRLKEFLAQALGDCREGGLPVVAWRQDREDWVMIMSIDAWLEMAHGYAISPAGVRARRERP